MGEWRASPVPSHLETVRERGARPLSAGIRFARWGVGVPVDVAERLPVTDVGMTSDDERDLRVHLERLKQEHRDLDVAIEALTAVSGSDVLQIQRLKKRKLQLKDRISQVEDELFPDIIA